MATRSRTKKAIRQELAKYQWYHRIRVADGIFTLPEDQQWVQDTAPVWNLILEGMNRIDFTGKRVLDVGCRDGLFSLEAERRGAAEILAIDNDLSRGAVEFLLPFLGSRVQMRQMNLYDLHAEESGRFDVILFFGVLYHLRHPFWALKKLVDCLGPSGILAVESAMLADPRYEDHSFLYCPGFEENPLADSTCCTLFNRKGLTSTLSSLACQLTYDNALDFDPLDTDHGPLLRNNRQFLLFQKDETLAADAGMVWLHKYWHETHKYHSTGR